MTLKVQEISKCYGGLVAVDKVSFTAQPGQVTAVIGPNGAGKTTLLNLVSGVVAADSGKVSLYERDISGLRPHVVAGCGLTRTFQSPQLFEGLTVLETAMVGAHVRGRTSVLSAMIRPRGARREEQDLEQIARKSLETTGVPESVYGRVALDLPYGLQRRVEVARALAMGARALLLDEPAAGLNDQEVDDIADLIEMLRHSDTIVVLVEHKMNMVMRISDHVVVMNFGCKIAEGPPGEVQANSAVIEAYLGTQENEYA